MYTEEEGGFAHQKANFKWGGQMPYNKKVKYSQSSDLNMSQTDNYAKYIFS